MNRPSTIRRSDRSIRLAPGVEGLEPRALMAASVLTATGVNASGHTDEAIPAEVATFTDSNPGDRAPGFTATVTAFNSVGSGITLPAVVTPDPKGGFDVSTTFQASAASSTSFTVAIAGDGGLTSTAGTLVVSGPVEQDLQGGIISIKDSVAASGVVTAADEIDLPGILFEQGFAAMVDWGDGTPLATVPVTAVHGQINVNGSNLYKGYTFVTVAPTHQYAHGGAYAVRVSIYNSTDSETVGLDALVVDTGLSVPVQVPVEPLAGIESKGLVVAQFQDSNGTPPAGQFTATIDWGDGSPVSPGTVTLSGSTYSISGDHTYAAGPGGSDPVTITLNDPDRGTLVIPIRDTVFSDANQRYVSHLYPTLLDRPADESGLTAYTAALDLGTLTRPQVAASMLDSPEGIQHRSYFTYLAIVGRNPDPPSLAQSEQLLTNGGTDEQAMAYLYASPESYAKDGGTDAGFLKALYLNGLGRPIDSGALSGYEALLASGKMTRAEVAYRTLTSTEYRGDLLNTAYAGLLGRPPTVAEFQAGMQAFQAGGTDEHLIATVVGSADDFAKA